MQEMIIVCSKLHNYRNIKPDTPIVKQNIKPDTPFVKQCMWRVMANGT